MRDEPSEIVIDKDIRILLRRMARARRMTLRVARAGGQVVLTMPPFVPLSEGRAFAQSRAGWLRRTRDAMPARQAVAAGALLPVQGRPLRITPAPVATVRMQDGLLLVPDRHPAGPVLAAWLKQLARTRLAAACDRHAASIGRPYRAISLRDTRSRWGSCSHEGRLMFSWRLAMAPAAVLDYVAAHEVAHLRHMDHSPAFWDATARLMPDYRTHRQWLRDHGHELHSWLFSG
ncbi:SprT family zinc-dependent metalloprotease [uncultured Paracoccus sp.]|uniref:M48 family metallopeptidase n=1 Tax=uncultured Paracoccus sp. TaxID=189685 RepID=UPI0025FBF766|nr:SprT family zinc-dependent metalloprotease [uncultured Paracoccus sp.]